jgi:hypothetical protein
MNAKTADRMFGNGQFRSSRSLRSRRAVHAAGGDYADKARRLIGGRRRHVPDAVTVRAVRLNQMYSLRYGTVPVVRAVGGLADTVRDYNPGDPASNGFVFHEFTPGALLDAPRRALGAVSRPERVARPADGRQGGRPFLGPFRLGVRQNV